MAQRPSGFDRHDSEHYPTPNWVVDALAEHLPLTGRHIWEPACGTGKMAAAMVAAGAADVIGTDIYDYGEHVYDVFDFIDQTRVMPHAQDDKAFFYSDIITNPPYGQQGKMAEAFIESGLKRLPLGGVLALLLQVDFDSGSTRSRFFRDCPHFAGKVVLTRRIRWFEPPPEKKLAGPSTNHSWFVFRNGNKSTPRIRYAPTR